MQPVIVEHMALCDLTEQLRSTTEAVALDVTLEVFASAPWVGDARKLSFDGPHP